MMSVAAVIPAAGRGKRLGARTPKAFYSILGKPLLVYTVQRLKKSHPFLEIVVCVHAQEILPAQKILIKYGLKDVRVIRGGSTRAESVRNGVAALSLDAKWVLVHDAARPFVTTKIVRDVVAAASKADGAVVSVAVSSTVKRAKRASVQIEKTEDRSLLYLAQTPQVFKLSKLKERYRVLGGKIAQATDEAALFDGTRSRILLSKGDMRNIKITTPEDVELMKVYLKQGF